MYIEIKNEINNLDLSTISDERKVLLKSLSKFIQSKIDMQQEIRLNFICTHNSRRSHLSQVWAQTIAYYFNINHIFCYSGGTEATALYPMAAKTLENTGFKIHKISENKNPVYSIKYADNQHPIIGFSKTMDNPFNPSSDFAAIMTCDSANESCPIVHGAEIRIPITYEDPKAFDNTDIQAAKYAERSQQIATEMFFVFSNIKST